MVFISLVGTDAMGVVNALLAVSTHCGLPAQVWFLGTEKALDSFKGALDFIATQRRFADTVFKFYLVSDSLTRDASGNPPVHEELKNRVAGTNEKMVFNIAGGMNFQIPASVQVIGDHVRLYTYPQFDGVHLFERTADGRVTNTLWPLPDPVDVLGIQGVDHSVGNCRPENLRLITGALASVGVKKLPERCRFNLCVAGIDWEMVWNEGNTLVFCKLARGIGKPEDFRNQIAARLTDRRQMGDLYHRKIALFCHKEKDRYVVEHAGKTLNKVNSFIYEGKTAAQIQPYLGNLIRKAVGLLPKTMHRIPARIERQVIDVKTAMNCVNALVVFLGTDSLGTLKAIWSHQPDLLILLYTRDVLPVRKRKEAFEKNVRFIPAKRVVFEPVDFTGSALLEMPVPVADRIAVNISPGTKSHAFFMSLWARRNRAEIYSFDNMSASVQSISTDSGLKQKLPDPLVYLRINGEEIRSSWGDGRKLYKQKADLKGLIRFIDLIHDDSRKIKCFPRERIETENAVFSLGTTDTGRIAFSDRKDPIAVSLRNNIWLEKLVGYMMMLCGASHVAVGTKVRWRAENEARLFESHGHLPHINDYDVIAALGGSYIMIECKSGGGALKDAVSQTNGLAKTLGRFTLPMLCRFNYQGPPKEQSGVWVFGHRTLTDTVALKALIDQAFEVRRTTAQTRGDRN